MRGDFESRQQWRTSLRQRKFLQIKFGSLAEIADRLWHGLALCRRSRLGIESDETTLLGWNKYSG